MLVLIVSGYISSKSQCPEVLCLREYIDRLGMDIRRGFTTPLPTRVAVPSSDAVSSSAASRTGSFLKPCQFEQ
jgi:hypothetical protein